MTTPDPDQETIGALPVWVVETTDANGRNRWEAKVAARDPEHARTFVPEDRTVVSIRPEPAVPTGPAWDAQRRGRIERGEDATARTLRALNAHGEADFMLPLTRAAARDLLAILTRDDSQETSRRREDSRKALAGRLARALAADGTGANTRVRVDSGGVLHIEPPADDARKVATGHLAAEDLTGTLVAPPPGGDTNEKDQVYVPGASQEDADAIRRRFADRGRDVEVHR